VAKYLPVDLTQDYTFLPLGLKASHIYRNVATYLPLGFPASTVTQSRCWPMV